MTTSAHYTACRFGSFVLDLRREALLGPDGNERPLRPKSFALLKLLVENAGRVVSRDVIMEALWRTVCVTENSVTQCIHDIRAALGAEGRQLLRTRPRRGYLFTPDVTALPVSVAARDDAALDGSLRQQLSPLAFRRPALTVAPCWNWAARTEYRYPSGFSNLSE
jgi:DNA-binding winged helix-turn-helix (wHTH) protein